MQMGNLAAVGDGPFDLISEPLPSDLGVFQDTVPTLGSEPSILDKIVSFGEKVIPGILSMQQQREINDINMERARKGLPPINAQAYLAQSAPQVRFGVTPDTQNALVKGAIVVGIGFAAFAVIRALAR